MWRVGQFVGGLFWALGRPFRRRRTRRLAAPRSGAALPPWGVAPGNVWWSRVRRGSRPRWREWEPPWDDERTRSWSRRRRRGALVGAGVVVLGAALLCLVVTVVGAIHTTRTTATVTGASGGSCAIRYTAPDGREQTGEVDCRDVRIGSKRTVWVLSDEPGDVVTGPFPAGGGLILTAAGALAGAALIRIGRGGDRTRGRHEVPPD